MFSLVPIPKEEENKKEHLEMNSGKKKKMAAVRILQLIVLMMPSSA